MHRRDVFHLAFQSGAVAVVTRLAGTESVVIGITAGASCPNNLIEETVLRVFELRGIPRSVVLGEGN